MLVRMEESSVLFNLNEIMRLERDRVSAEEAAVRAAEAHALAEREARIREQRERVAREQAATEHAAAERERIAREAAQAQEHERAAALLRVRLEAEATQRLADQQLELARTVQLHELEAARQKTRASWWMASALVGLCVASGAAYAYVLEPALRSAHDRSAALDRLTADAAEQTAALSRQMEDLRAAQARAAQAPKPAELTASQPVPATKRSLPPRKQPSAKPVATTADADLVLDCDEDDPLCGLNPEPAAKRRPKR